MMTMMLMMMIIHLELRVAVAKDERLFSMDDSSVHFRLMRSRDQRESEVGVRYERITMSESYRGC